MRAVLQDRAPRGHKRSHRRFQTTETVRSRSWERGWRTKTLKSVACLPPSSHRRQGDSSCSCQPASPAHPGVISSLSERVAMPPPLPCRSAEQDPQDPVVRPAPLVRKGLQVRRAKPVRLAQPVRLVQPDPQVRQVRRAVLVPSARQGRQDHKVILASSHRRRQRYSNSSATSTSIQVSPAWTRCRSRIFGIVPIVPSAWARAAPVWGRSRCLHSRSRPMNSVPFSPCLP